MPSGLVRAGGNVVRVRAPAGVTGGQQTIKVVGTGATQQIIKTTAGATTVATPGQASPAPGTTGVTGQPGMSGIQALAAAAAATSKIITSTTGNTLTTASGQQIRLIQSPSGQLLAPQGVKVTPMAAGQTAVIGGQTVRLAGSPAGVSTAAASPTVTGPAGSAVIKTAVTSQALAAAGGKQIILQKNPGGPGGTVQMGGPGQPQIVTLVKTPQGMQVAQLPKGAMAAMGQKTVATAGGPQIIQTAPGKAIPQGATIVKLVNAQGKPQTAQLVPAGATASTMGGVTKLVTASGSPFTAGVVTGATFTFFLQLCTVWFCFMKMTLSESLYTDAMLPFFRQVSQLMEVLVLKSPLLLVATKTRDSLLRTKEC